MKLHVESELLSELRNWLICELRQQHANEKKRFYAIFLLSKDGTASHTQQHFESNWFSSFFSETEEKKRDDASQKTMAEGHAVVRSCCVT